MSERIWSTDPVSKVLFLFISNLSDVIILHCESPKTASIQLKWLLKKKTKSLVRFSIRKLRFVFFLTCIRSNLLDRKRSSVPFWKTLHCTSSLFLTLLPYVLKSWSVYNSLHGLAHYSMCEKSANLFWESKQVLCGRTSRAKRHKCHLGSHGESNWDGKETTSTHWSRLFTGWCIDSVYTHTEFSLLI
jgi:hypothetical protein